MPEPTDARSQAAAPPGVEPAPLSSSAELRAALSAKAPLADSLFDALLPRRWRAMAALHWTPLEVCRRAVQLLDPAPGEQVLDVGSGVGKLCVVGALTSQATFVGVEQRMHLVRAARGVASAVGAARATFIHADALSLDWRPYRHVYLFNPFAELDLVEGEGEPIDRTIRLGRHRYESCVRQAARRLTTLAVGTRVLVFHDLGFEAPASFSLQCSEEAGGSRLSLWQKAEP